MSDYHQEQQINEDLQKDAERIFAYLERHVAPIDLPVLRFLMGVGHVSRKREWTKIAEMACSCGDE